MGVPVTLDTHRKVSFATDAALSALLVEASRLGLDMAPVMGLMYLPTQGLTRQFQQACRAVLASLATDDEQRAKLQSLLSN